MTAQLAEPSPPERCLQHTKDTTSPTQYIRKAMEIMEWWKGLLLQSHSNKQADNTKFLWLQGHTDVDRKEKTNSRIQVSEASGLTVLARALSH